MAQIYFRYKALIWMEGIADARPLRKVAKPKEPVLRALAAKEAKRILLAQMQTCRFYTSSRRRSWNLAVKPII